MNKCKLKECLFYFKLNYKLNTQKKHLLIDDDNIRNVYTCFNSRLFGLFIFKNKLQKYLSNLTLCCSGPKIRLK